MLKHLGLTGLVVAGVSASAGAGIVSPAPTAPDGPSFPAGWVIASPTSGTQQGVAQSNQQENAGTSYAQTFRTGASGFQIDKIIIYSGGKAGAELRLNIYPDPVGGEDTDGYVNTSFSTDLLNGGNGLSVTVNGSPGLEYITFDLTGADEITLDPNQQYAIELDIISGQMSWQRSNQGEYPNGNIYKAGTEQGFNGTPPANGRGERYAVGGTPQRDGFFALYAVPEPSGALLIGLGGLAMAARRRRS